jgi:hypothetical protein
MHQEDSRAGRANVLKFTLDYPRLVICLFIEYQLFADKQTLEND